MKRVIFAALALLLLSSCGELLNDDTDESTGLGDPHRTVLQSATKGSGGVNGQGDFCNDLVNPCVSGEGDCDSDSQCLDALICGVNNGPKFGMPVGYDVCVDSTCVNGTLDGDETDVDCGGSCGTCTRVGSNGDGNYCDQTSFPCGTGEGDCDFDSQCQSGLVCGTNNGDAYGFEASLDFCWPSHCEDGVTSGDESAPDCGGSCGTCSVTKPGNNGDGNYCDDPNLPCESGEGDCDFDSQCVSGLICKQNNGAGFGFASNLDFCVPAHCRSGIQDGDETGIDCGGSCGSCLQTGSNGDGNYCDDPNFPCAVGEGDCDVNSHCQSGLICVQNNGDRFGFDPSLDFCVAGHCANSTQDGDETGIDCGGSCGVCLRSGSNGDGAYCDDPNYPCAAGEGDCDVNSHCATGNVCIQNNGAQWGFGASLDFCEAAHCTNGLLDGDEFSVDCGGSCGSCDAFAIASTAFNAVRGVDVLADNSVIVGGIFGAETDFGGISVTPAGDRDGFIARYGEYGALEWILDVRSTGFDEVNYIKHIGTATLVAGRFSGTASIGTTTVTAQGGIDTFLASVADDGTLNWLKEFPGSGNENIFGLETDSAGNIIISGSFDTDINLGNGVRTSAGFQDVFVAKFNSLGQPIWDYPIGGADTDYIGEVGVDNSDNIWTTGAFFNSVDFGGGLLTSAGSADAYVLKLSSDGTHVDSQRFGSTGVDVGRSLQSDGGSGMVFTGSFSDVVNFLGSSLVSVGGKDMFLASLDSVINVNWVTSLGGDGGDEGRHVTVRSDGTILLSGIYNGANTQIGTGTFASSGGYDAFTTQYSSSGGFLGGTRIFSSSRDDFVTDTAWRSGIDYAAVGYFGANGVFAGNPLEVAKSKKADGFVIFTD